MRAGAILVLFVVGCSPSPPVSPLPLPSVAPSQIQAHPSPTPVGSQVALGPLNADGVPTSVSQQPVLSGSSLVDAIAHRADAAPLLAGGWFHGPAIVRYCGIIRFDAAVDSCFMFGLFERRVGGAPIWIARGDVPDAGAIAGAVDRPVAVRLHTHDQRCVAQDTGCDLRPVLDEIVWLGAAPADSPPPREIGPAPPIAITEDDAVRRATAESLPHTTPLVLRSVSAAPIWAALPSEELSRGDIWVWVVVFEARFVAPCGADCQASFEREEVFLDYVTGAHILTRT